MESNKPAVGVGACLIGHQVRYNAEAKRKNQHLQSLGGHVDFRSFCPEMAIGMGVPREPIRFSQLNVWVPAITDAFNV